MRSWPRFMPALLLTLSVILPVQAQSQPAAGRDTVVLGTFSDADILNLMFSSSPAVFTVQEVLAAIFTKDVARDNDTWRVFPQGVEYLPSVRSGTWTVDGERMTLVWKIKPRRWHDGRPVTCADYVFSHTVARDKRVGAIDQQVLTSRIASVSCPKGADGLEITVHWNERYGYANQMVVPYGALPRHILEPFYRANPSALREAPYGHDPKVTIGDGPYRLVEWRRGVSLTVEAVADHPIFGTPKIRRITWKIFPDFPTIVANLLSGVIDASEIDFKDALELERQVQGQVKVVWTGSVIWEHVDFNLDNPLLQDVRVRRALAHGINRAQIIQQLLKGRVPVSHTYLPRRHPGYTEAVEKYPYDPARARRLLQEAGFALGADGVMRNAAGQRLQFEINTTAEDKIIREQIEQVIQQQLRQIGVEITILNFPRRVLFGEVLPRRKFKALAMYAWEFGPESDCNGYYTSDGIPNEGNNWVGSNFPAYRSAEMDRICGAISRELDEEKRNRLLNDSARIFSRDLPALPLNYRIEFGGAKPGLRNLVFGIEPVTWNAHRWFWE